MDWEGKSLEIEPGKIYVLQSDAPIEPEMAQAYCKMFNDATGAKFVMISGGIKIARESTEQELREKIAKEITDASEELKEEAKAISSDAYLVASRTCMILAAIAKGEIK